MDDRSQQRELDKAMSENSKQEKINDFYLELLREFGYLLNYELAFKIAHMAGKHFERGAVQG